MATFRDVFTSRLKLTPTHRSECFQGCWLQETILHATSWIPGGGKYSWLSFTSEKHFTPICTCKIKRRIWRHNTSASCLFHKPTVVTSYWMQGWKIPSLAITVKWANDDARNKIMIWLTMNSVLFGHHVKFRGASRLETATQYKIMRPMWTCNVIKMSTVTTPICIERLFSATVVHYTTNLTTI